MANAKPPFDPSQPFKVWVPDNAIKPKFDPNAPYEAASHETQIAAPQDQTSAGLAGLQGFGEGGTLGYLPEIQAGVGSVIGNVGEILGGPEAESYQSLREAFRKRGELLKSQHPVASAAGNVAGAVTTLPMGGAMKGAGLAAKLGKATAVGSGYGALMNPNAPDVSDDVMANLKERGKNALIGGAFGLAGEALLGAGSGLAKAGEKTASRTVLKQMGTNAGQTKRILSKGELPKLESFMKDEGLMSFGKNTEAVMDKTNQILREDGPKIGQLYKDAQEQATILGKENLKPINGNDLADQIINEVKATVRTHPKRDVIVKEMESSVAPLRDLGENANIADVNDFRKGLDSEVSWTQVAKERDALQNAYVSARNTVANQIKSSINSLDQALGGNKLGELKKLNERFSAASTVNNISTQATGREMAKALMGHGIIGGGLGVGGGALEYSRSHDPLKALGAGFATAAGVTATRKFGAPVGFYGGKGISAVGRGIEAVRPGPGALGMGMAAPWVLMNNRGQNGR